MYLNSNNKGFTDTILSYVIALLFIVIFLFSQFSQAAEDTAICFNNPDGYNTSAVHLWDSNPANVIPSTQWPGHILTEDQGYYCYDPGVAVTGLNVIFNNNNNGQQTGTLNMTGANTCYQNGVWTTLADCGLLAPPTDIELPATALCYDNAEGFTNVSAHLWNAVPTNAVASTPWPGHRLDVKGNYFCYDTGAVTTSLNVIFNNNNNGQQTPTLTMQSPNNCYKNGNWVSLESCGFIVTGAENVAPTANAGNDITIFVGETVNFTAAGSSDTDGTIVSYTWDNGLNGISPSLAYNTAGTYNVTLTVTDNGSPALTATDTVVVTVVNLPVLTTVTETTVCYDNAAGYTNLSAHVWNSVPADAVPESPWPGHALNATDDYFCYDLGAATTSLNIIFNNGNNGLQTDTLTMLSPNNCYKQGNWVTLEACGFAIEGTADAGPDRTINVNTVTALSAAASAGDTSGAEWTSEAWAGTLTGTNVVTPVITATGTFTVTMTLDGNTDDFTLTVVTATQGLAERPLLTAPLKFPIEGSVSQGNYAFEPAFPAFPDNTFSSPVMVTHDGVNDLVYVVDKAGILSVFPNRPDVALSERNILLDISNEVHNHHEEGLISVAFHPNFAVNGYVYIYYIEGNVDGNNHPNGYSDGVLERITVNNTVAPTSANNRVEVLRVPQVGPDHKGGMMQFHPSTGEFFMSFGDGSWAPDAATNNNAQNTNNLLGTFIRIIMRDSISTSGKYYDIPSDNPFVNDNNILDEIWSYGHRNPWRWSFDNEAPYTLWEIEIGQDDYEEVNIITKGGNYGWPICEGLIHRGNVGGDANESRACANDLVAPVTGYDHDTGVSIVGGIIYRGTKLPALTGKFIYGDYKNKQIWSSDETEFHTLVSDAFPNNPSSFGTDLNGEEIFISAHHEYQGAPIIYRMIDSDAEAAVIPANLSGTGIFADLSTLIPAHGVIEYDVNSDGWFDGLKARHFVSVPNDQKINFTDVDTWNLPVGSVLIKHLEIPLTSSTTRPYETSVLFKQSSGNWAAANYFWAEDGSDATLVTETTTQTAAQYHQGTVINVEHKVRASSKCIDCHTGTGSTEPLGIDTRQLNASFDYQGQADNQIDVLKNIGLFNGTVNNAATYTAFVDPENTSADLNERARTYLDTNCAHCHNGSIMDLIYDTDIVDMDIMNVKRGDNYRMLPFDHSKSLLHTYQTIDSNRMPKDSALTNPVADDLFREWINAVNALQTSIKVNVSETTIVPNSTVELSALTIFNNGFEVEPTTVSWLSSNESVMSVTGTSGTITGTAVTKGNATITASSGGNSGTLDLTVVGAPNQPTNLAVTAITSRELKVTWLDEATDEVGYEVRRSNNSTGPFSVVGSLNANSEVFDDSGLTALTRYYYQIIALGTNANAAPVVVDGITHQPEPVDSINIISAANVNLISGETRQLLTTADASGEISGITLASDWQSSDNSVVSVSATGMLTAGNNAGTAIITATYQGVSSTVSVTNEGNAQYVYVLKPAGWAIVNIHAWTTENGAETDQTGTWPGAVVDLAAIELGGNWLRFTIPASWANNNGDTNIIFSDNGANEIPAFIVNQGEPAWYNGQKLANEPMGSGVAIGTQVQINGGQITLNDSTNLTGDRFNLGTVLDINADEPSEGLEFKFWDGAGAAYLVDPTAASTTMIINDTAVSYTLLAVFDTAGDPYVLGRQYYNDSSQNCAGCHGIDGTGGTHQALTDITTQYTLETLATYIESSMPWGRGGDCTGECATEAALMIYNNGYISPEICEATNLDSMIPQDRSYRLLSSLEYNNSIRDLLDINEDIDVTTGNVSRDITVNGFSTNANATFSIDDAKGYIVAAETAIELAGITNIYSLTSGCSDINCFLNDFAKRAFRRPLVTQEITELTATFNDSENGDLAVLTSILSAPAMLYRSEVGEADGNGYYQLTDYEIASMLSYTYWATTPNQWLMDKADAGELHTPAQISSTLHTMLLDVQAEIAFERFTEGWLDLSKGIFNVDLSDSLKGDMTKETYEFVRRTVFENGTYNDLLTADYSYMTEQLAMHYGITWPGGSDWQQIHYTDEGNNSERRGVLGHAGILSMQSTGRSTHPIKRGLFVRRNLMCQDFAPPPDGAALDSEVDPSHTVRERYEESHAQDSCRDCHQYIDGIGFGFENYNSQGVYTTTEVTGDGTVRTIDASGEISSLHNAETLLSPTEAPTPYHGLDQLAGLIADSSHGKACYARQWYRYSRGERESRDDNCTIQAFGQTFKNNTNASIKDLMVDFTQTANFTLRK